MFICSCLYFMCHFLLLYHDANVCVCCVYVDISQSVDNFMQIWCVISNCNLCYFRVTLKDIKSWMSLINLKILNNKLREVYQVSFNTGLAVNRFEISLSTWRWTGMISVSVPGGEQVWDQFKYLAVNRFEISFSTWQWTGLRTVLVPGDEQVWDQFQYLAVNRFENSFSTWRWTGLRSVSVPGGEQVWEQFKYLAMNRFEISLST